MNDRRWLRAAPLLFVTFWSGGFTAGKIAVAYTQPLTLLSLRFALVMAVAGALALILRVPWPTDWRGWREPAVIGLLIQGVYFSFFYLALDAGMGAGALALMMSGQPLMTALLAPLATRDAAPRGLWFGLALGFAGVGLFIVEKGVGGLGGPAAIGYAGASLCALTLAALLQRRAQARVHPFPSAFIQCGAAAVIGWPLALWLEPNTVDWAPGLIVGLLYVGLVNSILSVWLLAVMMREGGAAQVSSLFFIVTPLAAAIAWVILGERFGLLGFAGLALAALGVALALRPQRGAPEREKTP